MKERVKASNKHHPIERRARMLDVDESNSLDDWDKNSQMKQMNMISGTKREKEREL